jgi:hypothetical protein
LALVLPDLATPPPAVLFGLDEDVVMVIMVIVIRSRVGPVPDLTRPLQCHSRYVSVGRVIVLDAG